MTKRLLRSQVGPVMRGGRQTGSARQAYKEVESYPRLFIGVASLALWVAIIWLVQLVV